MKLLAVIILLFLESLAFSTNDKAKCEMQVINHATYRQDGYLNIQINIENNTDLILKYRKSPSSFGSIWSLRLCSNDYCFYEENQTTTHSLLRKSDYKSINSKSTIAFNLHVDLNNFTNEKRETFLNHQLNDKSYQLILKYSDNLKKGKKIIRQLECTCLLS
jgi:hypothetical protein